MFHLNQNPFDTNGLRQDRLRLAQLAAGADAELGEDLAQVPYRDVTSVAWTRIIHPPRLTAKRAWMSCHAP